MFAQFDSIVPSIVRKYENALKSESSIPPDGSGSLVKVQGSSDVSVFGASGNYHLFNASVPIVDIIAGSSNVRYAHKHPLTA